MRLDNSKSGASRSASDWSITSSSTVRHISGFVIEWTGKPDSANFEITCSDSGTGMELLEQVRLIREGVAKIRAYCSSRRKLKT